MDKIVLNIIEKYHTSYNYSKIICNQDAFINNYILLLELDVITYEQSTI